MSNKKSEKAGQKSNKTTKTSSKELAPERPWISMRTGLIIITITSAVMGILMAWSAIPIKGVFQGILWGIGAGVGVWLVFALALFFNVRVRGKRHDGDNQ